MQQGAPIGGDDGTGRVPRLAHLSRRIIRGQCGYGLGCHPEVGKACGVGEVIVSRLPGWAMPIPVFGHIAGQASDRCIAWICCLVCQDADVATRLVDGYMYDLGFRAGEAVVDDYVRGGMPSLVHGQPEGAGAAMTLPLVLGARPTRIAVQARPAAWRCRAASTRGRAACGIVKADIVRLDKVAP